MSHESSTKDLVNTVISISHQLLSILLLAWLGDQPSSVTLKLYRRDKLLAQNLKAMPSPLPLVKKNINNNSLALPIKGKVCDN